MKILEIIQENTVLTEQLAIALRALETAVGAADRAAVEKILFDLGRALSGTGGKTAVSELSQSWVKLAELSGMSIEDAIAIGRAQASKAGVKGSVVNAAERDAMEQWYSASAGGAGKQSVWDTIKQKFHIGGKQAPKSFFGARWDKVDSALKYLGWGQAVYECVEEIQAAHEWYNQNPTPENFKGMQWDVQKAIDTCLAKVLAIGVGARLVKGIVGGEAGIKAILPFTSGATITAGFQAAGSAAQTAFLAYLATPEGQKDLSRWLLGEILMLGPQWQWLTNFLSGWVKSGYDAVLRHLNSPYAQPLPDKNAPKQDIDAIIRKGDKSLDSQTRYNLGTGAALN